MDHARMLTQNREAAFDLNRSYPLVADNLATLVSDYRRWRLRRSETIELLGNSLIRRSVAIEFLMPNQLRRVHTDLLTGSASAGSSQVAVPLAMLEKRSLTGFSLRDDAGRDLPHLMAGENGVLSALLLLGLCQGTLALPTDQIDELLELALAVVFSAPGNGSVFPEADALVSAAVKAGSTDRALIRYFSRSLTTGFMLYGVIDSMGVNRRIVRFDYLDSLYGGSSSWWVSFWAGVIHPGAANYEVLLPAATQAQSFHVDLQVPSTVAITKAEHDVEDDEAEAAEAEANEHTGYAHFRDVVPGITPKLSFTIKLQRFSGAPLAALYSALILLLASGVVAITASSTLVTQNALWIPILLVVPAGYALFMGDGAEPHLLTRILRPFRFAGIIASLLLVLLALSILTRGDHFAHRVAYGGVAASVIAIIYLAKWYMRRRS